MTKQTLQPIRSTRLEMNEANFDSTPPKSARQRPFFVSNWFWRGTQSAIWYYIRCSPCRDFYNEGERKYAAHKANIRQRKIIDQAPELVNGMHYGPRQTNEAWADEIIQGPGPPKGWKKDKLATKIIDRCGKITAELTEKRHNDKSDVPEHLPKSSSESQPKATNDPLTLPVEPDTTTGEIGSSSTIDASQNTSSSVRLGKRKASNQSLREKDTPNISTRPSMDRRLSTAYDNIKDHIRTTLHPERWNWMRYDREDEIFPEFNQRMSKAWNKMTSVGNVRDDGEPSDSRTWYGRRRAETIGSDRQPEWARGRNPALNDLHPPAVSQLPASPEQAQWMLLPPPSADIMAGRARPSAQVGMRWPLAVAQHYSPSIEGPDTRMSVDTEHLHESVHSGGTRTPDLSQSSDDSLSDELESDGERPMNRRRSSAPIAGLIPMTPAPGFLKSESKRHEAQLIPTLA